MTSVTNHDLSEAAKPCSCAVPCRPGVLVADDMGLILTLLKFALEAHGFDVWLAVDGDDALDLYRRNRAEIDLVVLDVQMPGLDGPHTLSAIRRLAPDVLACFMTGDPGPYTRDDLLSCGAARVFDKPFEPAELARTLTEVLCSAGWPARPDHCSRSKRIPHAITETG
jgi:CheY-like chemotaxis protein